MYTDYDSSESKARRKKIMQGKPVMVISSPDCESNEIDQLPPTPSNFIDWSATSSYYSYFKHCGGHSAGGKGVLCIAMHLVLRYQVLLNVYQEQFLVLIQDIPLCTLLLSCAPWRPLPSCAKIWEPSCRKQCSNCATYAVFISLLLVKLSSLPDPWSHHWPLTS